MEVGRILPGSRQTFGPWFRQQPWHGPWLDPGDVIYKDLLFFHPPTTSNIHSTLNVVDINNINY